MRRLDGVKIRRELPIKPWAGARAVSVDRDAHHGGRDDGDDAAAPKRLEIVRVGVVAALAQGVLLGGLPLLARDRLGDGLVGQGRSEEGAAALAAVVDRDGARAAQVQNKKSQSDPLLLPTHQLRHRGLVWHLIKNCP